MQIPILQTLFAGVVKLADTPGLGPGARKGLEVQVLSPAPEDTFSEKI